MSAIDPSSTTAGDLVVQALKEAGVLGVGQTALAEDASDGLARLNWMLQEWERKRWLVYHLVTLGINPTTGAESYTVGPNGQINTSIQSTWGAQGVSLVVAGAGYAVGDTIRLSGGSPSNGAGILLTVTQVNAGAVVDWVVSELGSYVMPLPASFTQVATSGAGVGARFNLPIWQVVESIALAGSVRPMRLESAFLRQIQNTQPNQVDYPLQIIQSREDYNRIRLKSLVSFPNSIFYDSDWPLGSIFPWPVPSANIYAVYVSVLQQLASFTNLSARINVPYEYYNAIVTNLALRLRSKYGISASPGDPLPGNAKNALNVLRGANTQIATLQVPAGLGRAGIYNIFSDTFY